MAGLSTLSELPALIYAGDSLIVNIENSTYPASEGWSMEFAFRSQKGAPIDIASAANGSAHLFSVSSTTTATWNEATYSATLRAVKSTDKVTIWRGFLEIKAEPSVTAGEYDPRSWAKRCLDKIEAVIEGRASKDVLNSTIAGQSIGRLTPEQLFILRDRFLTEWQQEQRKIAAEQGKHAGGAIGISFEAP